MNLVCRLLLEKNFFFNDTATTEIYTPGYTLSLHDALPIYAAAGSVASDSNAVTKEMAETALTKAKEELQVTGTEGSGPAAADIKLVVQPYMEIKAESYSATEAEKTLQVEITPKYNLLVVRAPSSSRMLDFTLVAIYLMISLSMLYPSSSSFFRRIAIRVS